MGWKEFIREKAGAAAQGAREAHSKYNAYQEEQHKRKLESLDKRYEEVRRKQRVARAEHAIRKYEKSKGGTFSNMGYSGERGAGETKRQAWQGGYTGAGDLFTQPARRKGERNWWE
jgi:hypothetical protein